MERWRWTKAMTGREWARLSGFAGAVVLLHVVGWGLFLYYSRHYPALAGLGLLAYTFGLRHAFDADHIAAIDNTTRKMLAQDKRPLGVGFFFSLGHASIVFGLTAVLAFAAGSVNSSIPALQSYGGYVGASVSGTFLWIIGILNLLVLVDIVRIFREMKGGRYDKERLEQRLLERGFMNRFFVGRLFRFVDQVVAHVPARLPVRARFRHGQRGRAARRRGRCRDAPRAAARRSCRCPSSSPPACP